MRLVYAADLHGNTRLYTDLASLVAEACPEALLLGGDLCPTTRNVQEQLTYARGPLPAFLQPLSADTIVLSKPCFTTDRAGNVTDVPPDFLNLLPSMEDDLAGLGPAPSRSIWVCHAPPHGNPLDLTKKGAHAGSRAILRRIEHVQPWLTLHGHIHEAPALSGLWAVRIGKTISTNPGQGESLHAVVIDLDPAAGEIALRHTVWGVAAL